MKYLLAALACVTAVSAEANPISLDRISSYIQNLGTAEANFTQISSDGKIDTGKIYIKRPGRMRFEYATQDAMVLAGSGTLAIFDGKNDTKQYPLNRTPLNMILDRNVNIGSSRFIAGSDEDGGVTEVVSRDPKTPEAGEMRMYFTDNPVTLRKWVTETQDGFETTVILQDLVTGKDYKTAFFSVIAERRKRGLED